MSHRVQSVERGIDILLTLTQGSKTLTEVTTETGLSKATVFRLLASLNHENLVVKSGGHLYSLGPGCLRLMQGVMQGLGAITAVARPGLVQLRDLTGETVSIHIRVGLERICIEELASRQSIRYMSNVGASAPLSVGSAGRVLLACTAEDELKAILPAVLRRLDDSGQGSEWLLAEIEAIRKNGYCLSSGERVKGAAAISVPLHGRHGFVAALSVLGPAFRLPEERRLEILPHLRSAAEQVDAALVDGRSEEVEPLES
jgi:DNA-binding IclR family transcriptional regulator